MGSLKAAARLREILGPLPGELVQNDIGNHESNPISACTLEEEGAVRVSERTAAVHVGGVEDHDRSHDASAVR